MKAMMDMMRTMFTLPVPVGIWLGSLMVINMAVPLFYITTPEAQWTLAAAIAGGITMTMIFQAQGFVRLLGIGHIYWIPQVIWFATRLDAAPPGSLFKYWMWSIIVFNSLSIIVDSIDVFRYIKGERTPYLQSVGT